MENTLNVIGMHVKNETNLFTDFVVNSKGSIYSSTNTLTLKASAILASTVSSDRRFHSAIVLGK